MATATTTCSDAADMLSRIASRMGPYSRRGQIEIAGQRIGLTPRQSLRVAYQEWKTIPAHVMDRLRELYAETCLALDESADRKIEALNASSEKRSRERIPVDGGGDGRNDGLAESERRCDAEPDSQTND